MNSCPACSQAVSPNDLVCPKCGISLHHGTASAGPTSGGTKGPSLVLIVGGGVAVILLVFGCLISIGASLFMYRAGMSPAPTAMPAGSTMEFELEESDVPSLELPPDAPSKTENPNP